MVPRGASDQRRPRVLVHFDLDCFYAQVEEQRCPEFRDRPLGVTQKFLVVTSNYAARRLGVPKMASIAEARRRCPNIMLVNGEDLTPYRAASKAIMAALGRFGHLEKLGLDEAVVDISTEVAARVRAGGYERKFVGFVEGLLNNAGQTLGSPAAEPSMPEVASLESNTWLMVGSQVAAEIRAVLQRETGYKCACGIATSKMAAKLACGLHKPNQQTTLPPAALLALMLPLPVRKLPGVGRKVEEVLAARQVSTVAQLQMLPLAELNSLFGRKVGPFLHGACRGLDETPVVDRGPPKSISVEDSFRLCSSYPQAQAVLLSLAPDLVLRLDEEWRDTGRTPRTFTVKWRSRQGGWAFSSASCLMPAELASHDGVPPVRADAAIGAAMKLLRRALGQQPFHLVVLNIGASNFVKQFPGGAARSIRPFFTMSRKKASCSATQEAAPEEEPGPTGSDKEVVWAGRQGEWERGPARQVLPEDNAKKRRCSSRDCAVTVEDLQGLPPEPQQLPRHAYQNALGKREARIHREAQQQRRTDWGNSCWLESSVLAGGGCSEGAKGLGDGTADAGEFSADLAGEVLLCHTPSGGSSRAKGHDSDPDEQNWPQEEGSSDDTWRDLGQLLGSSRNLMQRDLSCAKHFSCSENLNNKVPTLSWRSPSPPPTHAGLRLSKMLWRMPPAAPDTAAASAPSNMPAGILSFPNPEHIGETLVNVVQPCGMGQSGGSEEGDPSVQGEWNSVTLLAVGDALPDGESGARLAGPSAEGTGDKALTSIVPVPVNREPRRQEAGWGTGGFSSVAEGSGSSPTDDFTRCHPSTVIDSISTDSVAGEVILSAGRGQQGIYELAWDTRWQIASCSDCGQQIEGPPAAHQEHSDFHLAMSLQQELNPAGASFSAVPCKPEGRPQGRWSRQRGKSEKQVTLDGYFRQSTG